MIPVYLSIVPVDKRSHRKIAQDNWGLTKEQMRGMHVHHRIPRHRGGTNDSCNLYVCSPSFHRWVWHTGEEWIEWANEGGRRGGRKGGLVGGRKNAESGHMARISTLGGLAGGRKGGTTTKSRGVGIFAPGAQSKAGRIGGLKSNKIQKEKGIGLYGLSKEDRSSNTKDQWRNPEYRDLMTEVGKGSGRKVFEEKKGAFAPENLGKGAKTTNSQLWEDPDHPELGAHHFMRLRKIQRENGLPDGKSNRVKSLKGKAA